MLKKVMLLALTLMLLWLPVTGLAAPDLKPIEIYINQQKIDSDTPPVIIDGRTLVPLRVISENLGADVYWNNEERTVRVSTSAKVIMLKIDDKTAYINEQQIQLDVPATIINNRTMVPLRFIGEALGAEVFWNNDTRTVTINKRSAKITGFSYEQVNGNPSVVLRGDDRLEYEIIGSDKKQLALDVKAEIGTMDNALYVYDEVVNKAIMGIVQMDPAITRVVIDLKNDIPYQISISENGKSIIISFTNSVNNVQIDRHGRDLEVAIETTRRSEFNYFLLSNPDRLVLDINGALLNAKAPEVPQNDYVDNIRLGQFSTNPDTVRVVFDLKDAVNYQVFQDDKRIMVVFSEAATIEDIDISSESDKTVISIEADGNISYELKQDRVNKQLIIVIPGVAIDKSLMRKDVIDVGDGIVKDIVINKVKGSTNYNLELVVNLYSYTGCKLETTPPSSSIELLVYKSPLKNRTIVVDPGHGGTDPGAVVGNYQEKDFNLAIGLKLKKILEEQGAKVLMTRESDITVDLRARAGIANEINADVFVSIHHNSGSSSATGTETLYYPSSEKKALAQALQKALVRTLGLKDRGIVERPGLVVTRETNMPSALVEVAFLTNSNDLQLIITDSFQQKVAQAIAEGIVDFLTGNNN